MGKSNLSGAWGEALAAEFLRKKHYKLVAAGFQCRFGEIDIIAEKDKTIIFVEVKTRAENSIVSPREAVDSRKQQRIILTANDYISKTETLLQPRFDVAEVTTLSRADGTTGYRLNYIENAF